MHKMCKIGGCSTFPNSLFREHTLNTKQLYDYIYCSNHPKIIIGSRLIKKIKYAIFAKGFLSDKSHKIIFKTVVIK